MKRYVFVFAFFVFLSVDMVFGEENPQDTIQSNNSEPNGIVYYLDGAGGGSFLTNWAPGVRKGLKKAGFKGEFKEFVWHTGLGVLADQTASVKYKRAKGKILADKIVEYRQSHPDRPITLIGLSAGTAVTIFALEALPETCRVEMVILLGSSMDASYDLTIALTRVEGTMQVYTSERDEVLNLLVPMAGSADRRYVGSDVAGLQGFHLPGNANEPTRTLYGKVQTIPWQPRFAQAGDHGGHTDTTNPQFVQNFIAPVILSASVRTSEPIRIAVSVPIMSDAHAALHTPNLFDGRNWNSLSYSLLSARD